MRMKQRMVKGTTAMALFAALVAYMVAHPRLVHATFPGQNGRISFALFSSNTNSTSIWSVRSDGSVPQQLTFDSSNQNSVDSNWSPDGSRIAFDQFSNMVPGIQDIFTMKADRTDIVQLTSKGFNGEPVYSPDSKTIAFESDQGQPTGEGIYLMNASDGTNARRVTVAPVGFFDVFPHFSPAGDRLVFSRVNTCAPRHGHGLPPTHDVAGCLAAVFLVNIDGSGLTQITPYGEDISVTDWSPDGTKLVLESRFDTVRGSKADVLLINVYGSNLVNLTNNPPISAVPCSGSDNAKFSPDSNELVFVQFDCINQPTLWIMKADGSGKHDTGIVVGGNVFMSGGVGVPDWGTNQN
jgi:Tol biopolymer transport system component